MTMQMDFAHDGQSSNARPTAIITNAEIACHRQMSEAATQTEGPDRMYREMAK